MATSLPGICRICKEGCGLLVSRNADGLTIAGNPEHPVSKGFICFRGKQFSNVQDSPARLSTPLLKSKSGHKPISWDDALDLICEKWVDSRQAYGPQSVCLLKGESLKHQEVTAFLRHLAYGFGTPNALSVGSICHNSLALGHGLTYGGIPAPNWDRLQSILFWGVNPANSMAKTFERIKAARKRGVAMIAVDPSETRTTRLCDAHLRITPGTDGLLALAFIKYFSEKAGLAPAPEESEGWEELAAFLATTSLADLLTPTNIATEDFLHAAKLLLEHPPVWIQTGLGLELSPGGVQSIRTIACLQALLDPQARPPKRWGKLKPLPGKDRYPERLPPIGADEFPLFYASKGEGQAMRLPQAILQSDPYPVKTMFIAGSNPMLTFPDPALLGNALAHLNFLVVFDLFPTQTAKLADLILPAATHLEQFELHDYVQTGMPYLGLINPADDTGKGWPISKVVFEMSRRLGLGHLFPWEDNRQALIDRMAGTGIEFDEIAATPGKCIAYDRPASMPGIWNTADGKIHFRADNVGEQGQPAIPTPESCRPPLELYADFPFMLSTGDRLPHYQHSQFRMIEAYRRMAPEPVLDIHPLAAAERGLNDGETVELTTPWGNMDITLALSDDLRPDCLRLAHGWDEANANSLGAFENLDPISGFPWLRALPAKIGKRRTS